MVLVMVVVETVIRSDNQLQREQLHHRRNSIRPNCRAERKKESELGTAQFLFVFIKLSLVQPVVRADRLCAALPITSDAYIFLSLHVLFFLSVPPFVT